MVPQHILQQLCVGKVDDPEDGSKALVSDGGAGRRAVHLVKDPEQSLDEALGQLGVLLHQLGSGVFSADLLVAPCNAHAHTQSRLALLPHGLSLAGRPPQVTSGDPRVTCVGVGQGVGFPLDAACRPRVLVDLLHRVEVDGVDAAQRRQADLVLAVLVGCLQAKRTTNISDASGTRNSATTGMQIVQRLLEVANRF